MKNFYRILEIEPNASKQAIKQAYKKLARKYHPDVLPSQAREDPSLLKKIQEINEAYNTLSDDQKRQRYDQTLTAYEKKLAADVSPFEHRSLLVKCSRTKRTYKMLLARRKNTKTQFEITGFESMDKPLLTGSGNWLGKLSGAFLKKPNEILPGSKDSTSTYKTSFYTEDPINITDIAWHPGIHCPDCEKQPGGPNLAQSAWCVCGMCKQLFYRDHYMTIFNSRICWCPWCGVRIDLGKPSDGKNWRIRGQEGSSQNKDQNLLSAEKPKSLSDGKNK